MSRETEDLIYYSCLPWLDLTSLTNEKDLSNEKSRCDSIPRIAWGKYINDGDKKILTISMEVNHRFIDGYHIGLFSKRCAEILKSYVNIQNTASTTSNKNISILART